jgi:hypothetical protein
MHIIEVDGPDNFLNIRKEKIHKGTQDIFSVYWERPNEKADADANVSSLGADYTEAGAFVIVAAFFAQRLKDNNQTYLIEHNAIMYASRVLGIPTAN